MNFVGSNRPRIEIGLFEVALFYCICISAALLEQAFLTQTKVQEHFRAVWKNESGLLKCILGALKIHFDTNSMEHPTDIFFIDVMPVPPPKFRPVRSVITKLMYLFVLKHALD